MLRSRLETLTRALGHRSRFEDDLADEIRFHIEARADDLMYERGLTREQALREARIEFGGAETVREECRRSVWLGWFDELRQDVSYAFRTLSARPGFGLIATATLALGIGANTAIFSVLDALVLRTLSVHAPEELHRLTHNTKVPVSQNFSWPFATKLRDTLAPHGAHVAAMTSPRQVPAGTDGEGRVTLQLVSGEYFPVLGVAADAGRVITTEDNRQPGTHAVAVVSRAYWRTNFGEASFDPARTVILNGRSYSIIGIAPELFRGVHLESPVDVWVPLMMQHQLSYFSNFSASNAKPNDPWVPQDRIRWLHVLVRTPGPNLAAVTSALNSGLQTEAAPPRTPPDLTLALTPFGRGDSYVRTEYEQPVIVLFVAVSCVLLIVCVNLASLLLSRAGARRREMAVRLSLGAARSRLIRQMLTESLVLAVSGGLLGLLVAKLGVTALIGMVEYRGFGSLHADLSWRVLAFTVLVSIATALLFGLLPAWRASRVDAGPALKAGAREVGATRSRLPNFLVAAQVALSLVLLTGAGLFLRSLANLLTLDAGFQPSKLMRVRLDVRGNPDTAQLKQLTARSLERVTTIAGVERAAASITGLVSGGRNTETGFVLTGYTPAPGERVTLQVNSVTPDYFRTVGMRLLAGREFTNDDNGKQRVAVVNESLARRYFRGDAVGNHLGFDAPDRLIVGVVADARVNDLHEQASPMLWYPVAETTSMTMPGLDVRIRGDAARVSADIRAALEGLDSRIRVRSVITLPEQIRTTLAREVMLAGISLVFGVVALLLAAVGLYGVMSYRVARRTSEIGVRIALGASSRAVLWSTMRQSLTMVVAGLVLGAAGAVYGGRTVSGLLFGIAPDDATQPLIAAAVLFVSAALAAFFPAWRASRVDPATALRYE